MYAFIKTANINELSAVAIKVEVAGYKGLPSVRITGLPDTAVKESYYRVSTSFKAMSVEMPLKKFVINFIPAGIPKRGAGFDLPIATALLKAIGSIPMEAFNDYIIVGELSLTGDIKPISGIIPILELANKNKQKVIIPFDNSTEAKLFKDLAIPLKNIRELIDIACGVEPVREDVVDKSNNKIIKTPDFSDVKGQNIALRCAEISAAGKHHLLYIGSPGCGKSMIGERIPHILPDLNYDEILEVNSIYSIAGILNNEEGIITKRPYRTPHHSISDSALIGGKKIGEISLAHKGILFLDELSEFRYNVLNALREPIERGYIDIARANFNHRFPANFILVAASNPCDCGNLLKKDGSCTCSDISLQRFKRRLNGPLMDRFDIKLTMSAPKLNSSELYNSNGSDRYKTSTMKKNVENAIKFYDDLKKTKSKTILSDKVKNILDKHISNNNISIRNLRKIINLARTIANLEMQPEILEYHILESINYASPFGWKKS